MKAVIRLVRTDAAMQCHCWFFIQVPSQSTYLLPAFQGICKAFTIRRLVFRVISRSKAVVSTKLSIPPSSNRQPCPRVSWSELVDPQTILLSSFQCIPFPYRNIHQVCLHRIWSPKFPLQRISANRNLDLLGSPRLVHPHLQNTWLWGLRI